MKFHENLSWGSRVPRLETDGRTDMTKPTVAFPHAAKAPKMIAVYCQNKTKHINNV